MTIRYERKQNRNSLMFPPDADADPSDPPPLQHASSASAAAGAAASASNATSSNPVLPLGEPKGIRYHATRLMDLERGEGRLDDGSEGGTPSPSRSRINAAISGTPCQSPRSFLPCRSLALNSSQSASRSWLGCGRPTRLVVDASGQQLFVCVGVAFAARSPARTASAARVDDVGFNRSDPGHGARQQRPRRERRTVPD